jgi:hypothetical protein
MTMVIIYFAVGCKKNATSTPAIPSTFPGNYYGILTYQGTAYLDTFKVTSTNNASQISLFDTQDSVYYTGTVSGNTITSLSGGYPANGGNSATTFTGSGSITSNTLNIKGYGAYTYSGQARIDTFSFIGTK